MFAANEVQEKTSYTWAIVSKVVDGLKADHPLFDWLINCVILNHFYAIKS